MTCSLARAGGAFLAALAPLPLAAQDTAAPPQDEGLLGDDFAREAGAIIVTADRFRDGNLFEVVETPKDSCLAKAPRVGESKPGFAIDARGLTKVSQIERIRRETRAGTIFISGGNFAGADFRKARIYNICFFGTDLSQTDWSGVTAPGLGFINTDLTGAQMKQAKLADVLFRDAKLGLVDASGASFKQGRMDGGWGGSLRGLDLTDADLTDFRFVCGTSAADGCPTDREGIVMQGANLRRASLHSLYVSDLSLAGARIDQTELALDHLPLLGDAQLAGPVVLRSQRRAMMLFPGEVRQLAQVAQAAAAEDGPCRGPVRAEAPTDPDGQARAILCAVPGSEVRDLLQTVTALEGAAQSLPGYETKRRDWLAARDACLGRGVPDDQANCIFAAYRERLAVLRIARGRPDWLSTRGYRLFLSREAAFPTDSAEPGLYGRILPVLLDTAVAAVILRSDGSGRADVKGIAVGGCGFEASGMVYEVERAQLGFAGRPRRGRPASLETPLLSLSKSSARVMDQGLVQAAPDCGPDNPFPLLAEVALDDRLLADIWDRF